MLNQLHEGDSFIDVGAHCGFFSVLASALVGHRGSVLAIEADATNYLYMLANSKPNMECRNTAISHCSGWRDFFHNNDNDGGHSFWNPNKHPWNKTPARADRRWVEPLDNYAHALPNVLKVDTEGAEVDVLRGASKILAQPQLRLVILEVNTFGLAQLGAQEWDIYETMEAAGFSATSMPDDGDSIGNVIYTR